MVGSVLALISSTEHPLELKEASQTQIPPSCTLINRLREIKIFKIPLLSIYSLRSHLFKNSCLVIDGHLFYLFICGAEDGTQCHTCQSSAPPLSHSPGPIAF